MYAELKSIHRMVWQIVGQTTLIMGGMRNE